MWHSGLRICYCSSSGCFCGVGSIPSLGIPTCHWLSQKKKKKSKVLNSLLLSTKILMEDINVPTITGYKGKLEEMCKTQWQHTRRAHPNVPTCHTSLSERLLVWLLCIFLLSCLHLELLCCHIRSD